MVTVYCKDLTRLWAFQCTNYYDHVRDEVEGFFLTNGVEDYFFIVTGITEAVNNSLLHSKSTQSVRLDIRITVNKKIFIRVADKGIGFKGNEYIEKLKKANHCFFEEKMYDENGRGVLMMYEIFDRVIYNEKGNEVLLVKDLTKGSKMG